MSKIFKNDAKKVKLTPKLEHNKSFPKQKEKICSDPYLLIMSALFWQKITKNGKTLGKFQKFISNYSDIIYE